MNYIQNEDFHAALLKRKALTEDSVDWIKNQNYIGKVIMSLTDKIASKACFRSYTYIDDMKGEAIEMCLRKLHKFDCEKSNNPYGYFTTVVHNVFLQFIEKEKRQRLMVYKKQRDVAESYGELTNYEKGQLKKRETELGNYEILVQKRNAASRVRNMRNKAKRMRLVNKDKTETE